MRRMRRPVCVYPSLLSLLGSPCVCIFPYLSVFSLRLAHVSFLRIDLVEYWVSGVWDLDQQSWTSAASCRENGTSCPFFFGVLFPCFERSFCPLKRRSLWRGQLWPCWFSECFVGRVLWVLEPRIRHLSFSTPKMAVQRGGGGLTDWEGGFEGVCQTTAEEV